MLGLPFRDSGLMRIGVKPGQWGWSFDELLTAWTTVEAEGFDRVEVGLGTGSWHLARHDHRVAGVPFLPFAERVERLEACCRVFPQLWRGETDKAIRNFLRGVKYAGDPPHGS